MEHNHGLTALPPAPAWGLLVGDVGRIAIFVGIATFLLAVIAGFLKKEKLSRIGFYLGCASVAASFAALTTLFVADQFQFQYVFGHSEKINALQYKIASIWSGQQGSFLLWAVCSAIFALWALKGTGAYGRVYVIVCSLFLGAICAILAYESPFLLNLIDGKAVLPPDGRGLTPTLYNYWVVIHPPTIFFGFGSLTILFAYAVAALVSRDYEDWVPRARPWAIVSTTLVGLGLCMGGFWAYEMLGWGGFWMWDPVENVSFVPWVLGAALIHGMIVQQTRRKWHFTNLMLAGLPFLSFVYGTFLTRSGFMAEVSVHSFATMERNALRLLSGLLIVAVVGFLALWFWRLKGRPRSTEPEAKGLKREDAYRWGMMFLCLMAIGTLIGTSVPLFQALAGKQAKVVEEQLYHLVLSWFFVPTMVLIAVTPFIAWRAMSWKQFFNRVVNVLSLTLFWTGLSLFLLNHPEWGVQADPAKTVTFPFGLQVPLMPWMTTLIFLCWFTLLGNVWRIGELLRRSPMGIGPFLSHAGLAIALAGLIISRGFERKQTYVLEPGSTAMGLEAKGPKHFVDLIRDEELNFADRNNEVPLRFFGYGPDFVARPGLYYDFTQEEPRPIVWPYIKHLGTHDIYVVLHPLQGEAPNTLTLKPGETQKIDLPLWGEIDDATYTITYQQFVREGEAGTRGTKFGAKLLVKRENDSATVTPKMAVGGEPEPAPLDGDYEIVMKRMDAADRTVELGFQYVRPIFPVDTFYKPMTALVWWGVGILTLGGFWSAFYRRRKAVPPTPESDPESETAPAPTAREEENALVPTA